MLPNQRMKLNALNRATTPKNKKPLSKAGYFIGGGYMFCSSLMLVSNKLAVYHNKAPAFVLFSQLFSTALICFLFGSFGIISVNRLEWSKVKQFIPVAMIFLLTIFSNIKILQHCNIETFIVFRATTPIGVSIGDYLCLGRELPSLKSWLSIIGIVIGSLGYMATDEGYNVNGYVWVGVWYFIFLVDQLYIKHVITKVKMSNWGRVYYTNLISSLPLIFVVLLNREIEVIKYNTFYAYVFLFISCVLGVLMSYFAYLARFMFSAASFTVLGNVCKIISVIINICMWDQHANSYGIGCLLLCLLCAYFYKQAPKKSKNDIGKNDMINDNTTFLNKIEPNTNRTHVV